MYDAKAEAREFVADNRAEAVAGATRFFEMDEAELRIIDADAEVYGMGGRAVIVAVPKNAKPPAPDRGGDGPDRGGRGRDRDDRPRERDRGGRDRGGRERGGRGRGRDRDRGDRGRERRSDEEEDRDRAPARAEPVADSKGTAVGEVSEIGEFVLGAIERMGLGPFELSESSEENLTVVELKGEAVAELGAGDGRGIDALQLLANQAAMHMGDDPSRVVLDVEGDREEREGFLARMAERAARRAEDTKRSVALDPMNGRDRRIVHLALRESDSIATMSIGDGRYRQVVVVPEGSPEFDEAERLSEEAASRD